MTKAKVAIFKLLFSELPIEEVNAQLDRLCDEYGTELISSLWVDANKGLRPQERKGR